MKILYFSKTSEIGPSSRYRIYQYKPYLSDAGIDCHISPLFTETYFRILKINNSFLKIFLKTFYSLWRFVLRAKDTLSAPDYDLVVIEHQLFPYLPYPIEKVFRILNRRTVVEFDDAIYLTFLHRKKMQKSLKNSSGVIAGNRFLAGFAEEFNRDVKIIPTIIDTEIYRVKENYEANKIVICWIGLAYNLSYLNQLNDVLKTISRKFDISLKIISSKPLMIDGVNVVFKEWCHENEIDDLRSSDIGIMPLPDNEWTKGKCGAKLLQYMACGLPSVSSPVGVNSEIINDGENGFLARSSEEWISRIALLIEDKNLREAMGRKARKTVEEKYSLKKWSEELAKTYLYFDKRI